MNVDFVPFEQVFSHRHQHVLGQCSYTIPPENVKKPDVFGCLQGA